ncbi:MAG: asparagine synthase-related protein, partial [Candidatus Entotheonellia bacterium]
FYALHRNHLYFAPELKALAHLSTLPKTIDWTALASFLSAGYFLNGHTLLDAVRLLDNATVLQITPTGLTTQRYWHYTFEEGSKDRGRAYYQRTLADLLRTAVHRCLRTPHRYGLLLSGGYDSRALLGYALAQPPAHPLHTISWGASEDLPHSDCAIAARLARRLALPHMFYPLRPHALPDHLRSFIALSDGLTDAVTNYPEALAIFHRIRHDLGLDILLRGDECFGWIAGAFDERTMFQTLGIHSLHDLKPYQSILTPALRPVLEGHCTELLHDVSSRCSAENIHNRKDFFYLDQRLQYYLHPLTYIKTLEVEVRTPYLDNDILDFVRTIPAKYRIEKNLFKHVVTESFPALFDEIANSTNLIDWNAELKKPYLKDFMYALLVSKESCLPDFLDVEVLASSLHAFYASRQPAASHTGLMKTLKSMLVRSPSLYTLVQR